MNEDMIDKTVYLGDGVYASWDGFQIKLETTDQFFRKNTIYLDDNVLEALRLWSENLK